jgi:hypothetical protein
MENDLPGESVHPNINVHAQKPVKKPPKNL